MTRTEQIKNFFKLDKRDITSIEDWINRKRRESNDYISRTDRIRLVKIATDKAP